MNVAWRSLLRAPSLTAVSVLTIALGVGAGTSLFGVVKAVLLNPLPYPEPNRLSYVASVNGGQPSRTSLPDFDDWHQQNRSFTALAAYSEAPLVAGGSEAPERTVGAIVSEDFFDVMGVKPAMGRTFTSDEHRPGARLEAVVIGRGLWRRVYGGDPNILGRKITVLGFPSIVVGVMPEGFAFPPGSELWVSARALNDGTGRSAHNYWVVGRLKPGATIEAARQDVSAMAGRLKQQYPGRYQTEDATATSLASHSVGTVRAPLLMLFGAVGLLLLIVCVNVANLLLVRVTGRSRELAIRAAVGARGRDLFRHLLMESLMLAAAGGALGIVVAFWSTSLIRALLPAAVPRSGDVRVDAGVIAFGLAVSATTGVLFGTFPSWRGARVNIHDLLKAGARGQTATTGARRAQAALVVSEVALSLVLVAGAGLLLDSFARLRAVDAGFSPAGVLTVNFSLPVTRAEVPRLAAQYRDLLERVRALPGVEAAGIIKDLPLDPIQRSGHFFIENRRAEQATDSGHLIVTPGLMEALRIPIGRGRGLLESDSETSLAVIVIGEEMARRFWPGRDPIGERIWFNSFEPKEQWRTIVGIAGDVRQLGLTTPAPAQAYVNYSQEQIRAQLGSGNLILRSSVDPTGLASAVRTALRGVSPGAAASFKTMDSVMADATSRQRFQMQVLLAFAALALALAAVGLYGVLSFAVASDRAAIGIRMALGARPSEVFGMVARRALGLAAIGAGVGLIGCLAARKALQSVVFGVGPSDPTVLTLAVAIMLTTALAACWFPARNAMRVDPLTALRDE